MTNSIWRVAYRTLSRPFDVREVGVVAVDAREAQLVAVKEGLVPSDARLGLISRKVGFLEWLFGREAELA
jgi:hypothetical protein